MNKSTKNTSLICGLVISLCVISFAQDPNFYIYLCFGQSNMCGAGSIEAQDKTVDSRFQMMEPIGCTNRNQTFGKWYPAVPPLWGCNGGLGPSDYFGRTMVKNLPATIKVGVIVVAVPGCDILLFDKKGYKGYDTYNTVPTKYSGSAYAWLMELARLAEKDGVIKGFLLHQGETMPDASKWPGQVKGVYDSLIADLKLDPSKTPLLAGEMLYGDKGGCCQSHNTTIAKLPTVIPNSYVISAQGLAGKDQYHFTTEGNRTLGTRYGEKMLTLVTVPVIHKFSNSSQNSVSQFRPISVSGKGAQITLEGDFGYRIFNFNGALIHAGKGRGALSVGAGLAPGMYFLSVENTAGCVRGKTFKR
jgi:hypothetical protein